MTARDPKTKNYPIKLNNPNIKAFLTPKLYTLSFPSKYLVVSSFSVAKALTVLMLEKLSSATFDIKAFLS